MTEGAAISRRTVLKGLGAAGLAAGVPALTAASARAATPSIDWAAFEAAVARQFRRMGSVGAAFAVVSADRVLHARTLGVRDTKSRKPVNRSTHFMVASTTKSMSSLLVATFVDGGKLQWDETVIDVWPAFRAPTAKLTRTLRVRDLLSMDTGIGEPDALSAIHQGDPTAPQLLQSIDNLPLLEKQEYFYNNTVYAVGGYLPAIRHGASGDGLTAAYAKLMRDRVYRPTGMRARLGDDPRGLVANYSRGHGPDLIGGRSTLPYGPVGSYWPVGGAMATLDDMIAYVRLHLRGGVSVNGRRVVSEANLAERWKPGASIQTDPTLDPDAVSAAYGLGLVHERYRDGTSLVWHNGGIDGFTTFIGFFPQHDLGLVVLNNTGPEPTGLFFYLYVLNQVLRRFLGLNRDAPAAIEEAYGQTVAALHKLGRASRPVEPRSVTSHFGFYEGAYRLVVESGKVTIRNGPRRMPLRKRTDGGYIISGGPYVGVKVELDTDADGIPRMGLVDLKETVRRTVRIEI
jgi:CubicO group peptidase (beta-lactamase class C family)